MSADHVMFDECIDSFRREREGYITHTPNGGYSYLLSPFLIQEPWDLGVCTMTPMKRVDFMQIGPYSSFVSQINNPNWVNITESNLFGLALASIISFATMRLCKSTRDNQIQRYSSVSERELIDIAMSYIVMTHGPGAERTDITLDKQRKMQTDVKNLIDILYRLDYKKYKNAMQSIRLVHLSMLTKRDDFGLAYLLAVSAIESVAQQAIKRDKVKSKPTEEKDWDKKAQEDPLIKSLFDTYKSMRGNDQYLRERFVMFLKRYAPVEKWEEYVEHPYQDHVDSMKESDPSYKSERWTRKMWWEKYPRDLTVEQIDSILSDAYKHRSCFVHTGEQPPHKEHTSTNRFFQETNQFEKGELKEIILPNYNMMLSLARCSIFNWLEDEFNKIK